MANKVELSHEAWILVCDGRKALVLRNEGDRTYPNLIVEQVLDAGRDPPTHEQGTDRPGRVASGTHRSAVEQTDWHTIAEDKFALDVLSALEARHRASPIKALILVAPPHILADLRHALPADLRAIVTAEVNKDLTKMPVGEIERHLSSVQ